MVYPFAIIRLFTNVLFPLVPLGSMSLSIPWENFHLPMYFGQCRITTIVD